VLKKFGIKLKISQTGDSLEELITKKSDELTFKETGEVIEAKNPEFLYIRGRAITADEPNGNGDYFPKLELEASYKTFIGVNMFINHESDDPRKAIGKVLDAYPIEDEKTGEYYIECLGKIDKKLNPKLARQIETKIVDSTSMGANVETSICSICGIVLHTDEDEKCAHLGEGILKEFKATTNLSKYGISEGQTLKAYAINVGVVFNEWSIVDQPADAKAKIDTIIAKLKSRIQKVGSLNKEERAGVINELEKIIIVLDPEDIRKVRSEVCSVLDGRCNANEEVENMKEDKKSAVDKVLEKLNALEYRTLMDLKDEVPGKPKEPRTKEKTSNLNLDAFFTKEKDVGESYWEIKEGDKILLKATLNDIWGEKELKGEDFDLKFAISDEYKQSLLQRIRDDGLKTVSYLLTGKGKVSKKDFQRKAEKEVPVANEGVYRSEKNKALKNLPKGDPAERFRKKYKAQQGDIDTSGVAPEHKKWRTIYDIGLKAKLKEAYEMFKKKAEKEGSPSALPGTSDDAVVKKFRSKYKANQGEVDVVSPSHKKHKTVYDIGLKDRKIKKLPEGGESSPTARYESEHKKIVKKVEEGTKSVPKSQAAVKTIYQAGTHLLTSRARKIRRKLRSFLKQADIKVNTTKALEVFTEKMGFDIEAMETLLEKCPDCVKKFAVMVQAQPPKGALPEEALDALGKRFIDEKGKFDLSKCAGAIKDEKFLEVGKGETREQAAYSFCRWLEGRTKGEYEPTRGPEASKEKEEKIEKETSLESEASAFDKQETIILGDDVVASKDKESGDIIVKRGEEEIGRYPDGFGDDIPSVIKLLREVSGLEEKEEGVVETPVETPGDELAEVLEEEEVEAKKETEEDIEVEAKDKDKDKDKKKKEKEEKEKKEKEDKKKKEEKEKAEKKKKEEKAKKEKEDKKKKKASQEDEGAEDGSKEEEIETEAKEDTEEKVEVEVEAETEEEKIEKEAETEEEIKEEVKSQKEIDLEARLQEAEEKNLNLEAEHAISKKKTRCKALVAKMVEKELLSYNEEKVEELMKEGVYLLDARAEALELARKAQLKEFMAMDNDSLVAFEKSVDRMKKVASRIEEVDGIKKVRKLGKVGLDASLGTDADGNWMQRLPWD